MKENSPTHFVVIGVHKAGTTTLYQHLQKHPAFFSPYQKELHYFTPMVYGNEINSSYYKFFRERKDEKYLLDISPSYLYGPKKIPFALKKLKYPVKCAVVLRDPTQRFVSFYKQGIKTGNVNRKISLLEYFGKCKEAFEKYEKTGRIENNFFNRGLREGCYSLFLPQWKKEFGEDLKLIFFENLIKQPKKVFEELYEWLDTEQPDFTVLKNSNTSFKPRFQWVNKWAIKLFLKYERFFRKNEKVKKTLAALYGVFNKQNYKDDEFGDLRPIQDFYKKYNEELMEMFPGAKKEIQLWK